MPFPVIKLSNVRKCFGKKIILNGISLDIHAGEIFGLIGASGAGKSTFLRTLVGFMQPDTGEVLFQTGKLADPGSPSRYADAGKKPDAIKKLVGYASQSASVYPTLNVEENIDYFASLYNLRREIVKTNRDTLINLMGLDGARKTLAKNLSGGMQRRLDIACALIHDPKILILDEPTADLDPLLSKHIWEIISTISRRGTTIIVSSHHIRDMENVCTRIGLLRNGKLDYVGDIQHFTERFSKGKEIHVECYPGNYDKVISVLKNPGIITKENHGYEMVVTTRNPEAVLPTLFSSIEKSGETLMDIRIQRISQDDIFVNRR